MKVFNSLTRELQEFIPLNNKQSLRPNGLKKVTIYVCGITPYDTTHLGHAFTYISFDTLIRYLKFKGFEVIYTQNITDINDRDKDILERAKEQNIAWNKLAEIWTEKFLEDMQNLNWIFPDFYLKASEHIPQMIHLIQKLLDKKLAYQVRNSVYLDISKFPDYGKLSGLSKDEMLKVSKDFEEDLSNPDKKNPLDICLWRESEPNQPSHIPSFYPVAGEENPGFGAGRPGWHLECSSMAISTLGEQIDIHGGGGDLKFPHHEAEIVQSEGATGKIPFAKYWLHTGVVSFEGEKMSKSKGNLVMVSDLLKRYLPNAIRWLLLSNHWSKNWEFKEEDLISAQKNIEIIEEAIQSQQNHSSSIPEQFTLALDDNLNTPKTLEFLLELAKENKKELKNLYEILGFKI